jgi:cobalt/nickel transport system permease protein
MRHDVLDRYSRLDSPVHRLPASLKLAVALAVVLATALTPKFRPWYFCGVALLLVIWALFSRIPLAFLLRRILWLEPFVLGVAVLSLFQAAGGRVFLLMATKGTLCLVTMVLLANTTPFAELLGLLRRVHVPGLLVTTLALMYRYLFVLMDETERMRRARASRTFGLQPVTSVLVSWKSLGTVIGQLFIRSTERAERIYAAMCARGWK